MLFTEETYGEDADGLRGVTVWCHKFENTEEEKEEIASYLYDGFLQGEESGATTIILINPHTEEDVEVEVEIENYIDLLIAKIKEDKDINDCMKIEIAQIDMTGYEYNENYTQEELISFHVEEEFKKYLNELGKA